MVAGWCSIQLGILVLKCWLAVHYDILMLEVESRQYQTRHGQKIKSTPHNIL
jgi:hypothetical protein